MMLIMWTYNDIFETYFMLTVCVRLMHVNENFSLGPIKHLTPSPWMSYRIKYGSKAVVLYRLCLNKEVENKHRHAHTDCHLSWLSAAWPPSFSTNGAKHTK